MDDFRIISAALPFFAGVLLLILPGQYPGYNNPRDIPQHTVALHENLRILYIYRAR